MLGRLDIIALGTLRGLKLNRPRITRDLRAGLLDGVLVADVAGRGPGTYAFTPAAVEAYLDRLVAKRDARAAKKAAP